MRKIAINASNLHVGGGVQVAVSFIYELSLLEKECFSELDIIASSKVHEGLVRLNVDFSRFVSYEVLDLFGLKSFLSPFNNKVKDYKTVFTVFGPSYLRAQAENEVVGFAQLWILEFDNPIARSLSFANRLKQRLKRSLQWLFFKRADKFIVELEHVKNKLIARKSYKKENIYIVHNTVSSLYFDEGQWGSVVINKQPDHLALGIVSRDYPHKNINIFPLVADILLNKYNIQAHFYVTFNDDEWAGKDEFFKKHVTNVGMLTPDQCPSFYQQMDGIVFPSLLECFSATPLETLVMGKPLFASDRDFVRDVCAEHAFYFDPLKPDNIARVISDYFLSAEDNSALKNSAKEYAINFSSAKARAERYLEIIRNQ